MQPKFELGRVVGTPGAIDALDTLGIAPGALLRRHVAGDWGDVPDDDRQVNEDALIDGDRLHSAYQVSGVRFWVITESDRSVTTILLPEEY